MAAVLVTQAVPAQSPTYCQNVIKSSHTKDAWCSSQALNTGLEELPEDDEEDVDFTLDELDGLLGPIDSDAEDNLTHPEAEPRQAPSQSQATEKRLRRTAANQEQQRWAAQQAPHHQCRLHMRMRKQSLWLFTDIYMLFLEHELHRCVRQLKRHNPCQCAV